MNTVDPMKLTQEFGNILADPIIATRVVASFIVHRGLSVHLAFRLQNLISELFMAFNASTSTNGFYK